MVLDLLTSNMIHLNESDMTMIIMQPLEWVQGKIQDLILHHVTRDWPFYDENTE